MVRPAWSRECLSSGVLAASNFATFSLLSKLLPISASFIWSAQVGMYAEMAAHVPINGMAENAVASKVLRSSARPKISTIGLRPPS